MFPKRRTTSAFASTLSLWMRTVEARFQSRAAPLCERNIKICPSLLGGDRRCHEVIVSGVEQNYSRANFTPSGLVKSDPNQDRFTGLKRHHLSVLRRRRPHPRMPPQTFARRRATRPRHPPRPTAGQLRVFPRSGFVMQYQAAPRFVRSTRFLLENPPSSRKFIPRLQSYRVSGKHYFRTENSAASPMRIQAHPDPKFRASLQT